jgi:type VI secretion system protein ImpL
VWWLNWVRQSWLGATPAVNPCVSIRAAVAAPLAALVQNHGYPQRLGKLADDFANETCFQPAMQTLAGLSVAPYGPMFRLDRGILQLNPALRAEFAGLADAMNLSYMRLAARRGFACRADASGWNPAVLVEASGYARSYLEFARTHNLADATPQPIYDRLARERLQAVLEDRLSAAQQARAPLPMESGVSEVSSAERRLARESADFAAASAPLLEVLNLTRQLGFADAAQQATACAVAQAGDALRRAQTLADYSRLYDASQDGADLSDLALARDWLDRQVKRARVLTGYASAYVAFMNNVADAATAADARSNRFWSDSVNELERHLQFKEPNGQVAYLHNLFLKTLAGPEASCRKRLTGY